MILRAKGPVPSPFKPLVLLAESPPRAVVDVDAPSAFAPEESGTWVPATGASLTLCFLGQPDSSAAPVRAKATISMRFIELSIRILRLFPLAVRVPTMGAFVY